MADLITDDRYPQQLRKAFFADVLAILRKHRNDLLSFEEARKALRATQQLPPTTETIPVDKIVGSVGRYKDFTRAFLPRAGASADRWRRLDRALERLETIPPIEVYQLGDVYFVRDGNHRVSVAKANGVQYIEARVTRVTSRVPLTTDAPDQLEIIREYARFLDETDLDNLRPQQRIWFSAQGHYKTLLEHIAVHRYFMGLERKAPVSYAEAVADWYDNVYDPIVQAIRRYRVLEQFPGRTEADLYLWLVDHQYYLSERYGPGVSADLAAEHFVEEFGGPVWLRVPRKVWRWIKKRVSRAVSSREEGRGP